MLMCEGAVLFSRSSDAVGLLGRWKWPTMKGPRCCATGLGGRVEDLVLPVDDDDLDLDVLLDLPLLDLSTDLPR